MTQISPADRAMVQDLIERAGTHLPDYTDEVLAMTTKVHQRPAWTFPSRWLPAVGPTSPALRWALVAALLGLALVAGMLAWSAARPEPMPRAWANGPIVWGVGLSYWPGATGIVIRGAATIDTIDPATGDVTPMTDIHSGPVAFAPDGTRLAFFASNGKDFSRRLFTSAPDGRDVVASADVAFEEVYGMSWSPDGRWIAASGRFPGSGVARIVVFAADGSGEPILDLGGLDVLHPDWAPAGDRIVFAGAFCDDARSLYTVSVGGAEAPVLLMDLDTEPSDDTSCDAEGAWSPDGQWIAYVRRIGTAGQATGTAVHLVRPDGSGDRVVPLPDGWNTSPTWSPDGRTLLLRNEACVGASTAYCRQWTDKEAHLLVVPIDGTPARQVGPSSTNGWLRNFAWSPDGRMIVVAVEGGAAGEVGTALIDVATNTWRIVGEGTMAPGPYAWQPLPTALPVQAAPSPAPVPTPTRPST